VPLSLYVDRSNLHLFDAQGKRIEPIKLQ